MGVFQSLERQGGGCFTGYFTPDFMTTAHALNQARRILHSAFPGAEIDMRADGNFMVSPPDCSVDDVKRLDWEDLDDEQLAAHMRTLNCDIVLRTDEARAEFTLAILLNRAVTDDDLAMVCEVNGVVDATTSTDPAHKKGNVMLVVIYGDVDRSDIKSALRLPPLD